MLKEEYSKDKEITKNPNLHKLSASIIKYRHRKLKIMKNYLGLKIISNTLIVSFFVIKITKLRGYTSKHLNKPRK